MNVFFDVDYTILSMDGALRPRTREVFERLVDDGHDLYVWSGKGIRADVVRDHGLETFVRGLFEKPTFDYTARLTELGVRITPDCVIDDHYEVVRAFGGVVVRPFYFARRGDQDMLRVYDAITDYAMQPNGGAPIVLSV